MRGYYVLKYSDTFQMLYRSEQIRKSSAHWLRIRFRKVISRLDLVGWVTHSLYPYSYWSFRIKIWITCRWCLGNNSIETQNWGRKNISPSLQLIDTDHFIPIIKFLKQMSFCCWSWKCQQGDRECRLKYLVLSFSQVLEYIFQRFLWNLESNDLIVLSWSIHQSSGLSWFSKLSFCNLLSNLLHLIFLFRCP